jgi:hypothetical protein
MLPSPPEDEPKSRAPAKGAPRDTYVGAAIDSLFDLDPFCAERSGVCRTAGYVIGRLEAKARYNFDLLYDWARSEHVGGELPPIANQARSDPMATGTIAGYWERTKRPQNTLRLDDLIPAWRGPGQSKQG